MQHIEAGARSISLLFDLHFDWFIYVGILAAALMVGAFVGSL